ncbi:unnamed protein product [Protopolystoma xenopodis]|uniref:Anaphase-promoting complex subunit 4 WD40 domain-containing protein n=1 Tax=Protopolystoma xenopodis TaxID=117903 RepID=A0A448X4R6_9PLAT|nr:unnamed protein product [Protopolystoma xenopodis]
MTAMSSPNSLSFAPGGSLLALLERRDLRDHISLFECNETSWRLLRNFILDETDDADGLLWSPDGRYLAVYDSCLKYRLLVYSIDGRKLASYSAFPEENQSLGIKTVNWSPTGQLLAIGS